MTGRRSPWQGQKSLDTALSQHSASYFYGEHSFLNECPIHLNVSYNLLTVNVLPQVFALFSIFHTMKYSLEKEAFGINK